MSNTPTKSIGFEVKQLAILIGRAFDRNIFSGEGQKFSDLTAIQSHIIGFIHQHENYTVSQSEVEKEFSRRRSTITGILKLMEKNGYITREYSKRDARVKMVTLTDKAIQLHQDIMVKMETFNQELEKGLTLEEKETFYSIIDKIKSTLE